MPKSQPRKDSTSDSDSGPDDKLPVKKSKPEEKAKSSGSGGDEVSWSLTSNRQVELKEFKGKWYVSIREYYMDAAGEMKPGKKGIMLTMEQWQKFKSFLPDIEESIKKHV